MLARTSAAATGSCGARREGLVSSVLGIALCGRHGTGRQSESAEQYLSTPPAQLESMYLPGTPRIAGFNYWGFATHG